MASRESAIPRLVLNIGQVRRKKGARRIKKKKKKEKNNSTATGQTSSKFILFIF
jgi:hypothetical protein